MIQRYHKYYGLFLIILLYDRMKNFSVKVYNTFIIGTADIWNDYLLAAAWGGNFRRENVK